MNATRTYPDQYLHVLNQRTGETWIHPFRSDAKLDLERLVRSWARNEFEGELKLDGDIAPQDYVGEYYARIMLDGRPPESIVCWESGSFFLTTTY